MRFTATAVTLDTGDDVAFDTGHQAVTADHVRASAALLTAFPAMEIDGKMFVDGGLSANLPLDPVLSEGQTGTKPTLCIASDLLPLRGPRPVTLGEVVGRMQDLTFAAQSRRTIARWQAEYDRQSDSSQPASVTLIRLAYSDQEREIAGKAMDFSPESARFRWAAGKRDALYMLDKIERGVISVGLPGLSVIEG